MKRRDLVAEIQQAGCVLLCNEAKHGIYHKARGTSVKLPKKSGRLQRRQLRQNFPHADSKSEASQC